MVLGYGEMRKRQMRLWESNLGSNLWIARLWGCGTEAMAKSKLIKVSILTNIYIICINILIIVICINI